MKRPGPILLATALLFAMSFAGCSSGSRGESPGGSTTVASGTTAPRTPGTSASPANGAPASPATGPGISALQQGWGPVGAPVAIVGSGFGAAAGTVSFAGTPVQSAIAWSDGDVRVLVPPGASSGDLELVTAAGTTYRAAFVVTTGQVFHVSPQGSDSGPGSASLPYRTVQKGLDQANPGDFVVVRAGTYAEELTTRGDGGGTDPTRIVVTGYPTETALVQRPGRLLTVGHACITIQDLGFDSQFGSSDAIRANAADRLVVSGCRIQNAGSTGSGAGDGIDIEGGRDILVEGCEIFDCLSGTATSARDSHGVVAGNFTGVTIRRCRIYRVSGDCVQADPDRDPWDRLVIEDCELYTEPLPRATANWNAGEVPGENALDTKADPSALAQSFVVRDCLIRGFRPTPNFSNRAALNIKNAVTGVIERCTITGNEIALRIRAPAVATVRNCVVYGNSMGMRYEDGVQNLHLEHCSFADNARHFRDGGGGGLGSGFLTSNSLFQDAVPSEAQGASNLAADPALSFVDANGGDYRLLASAPAVDAGVSSAVQDDRDGTSRPRGAGPDVGAYER